MKQNASLALTYRRDAANCRMLAASLTIVCELTNARLYILKAERLEAAAKALEGKS